MKKQSEFGYNERLFAGGLRGRLHHARFHWLATAVESSGVPSASVLELGCFDGKTIDFLPAFPQRYLGLDANWEGGLDLGRERWADASGCEFRACESPTEMGIEDERFDIAVCMETLEHVPPELVEPYLAEIARVTTHRAFFTVPNEIGPVFAAKHLAKVAFAEADDYRLAEYINATLGRSHRVARHEHKGFDYRTFVEQVGRHFEVLEVSGHPLGALPPLLNFGVGVVARPRR